MHSSERYPPLNTSTTGEWGQKDSADRWVSQVNVPGQIRACPLCVALPAKPHGKNPLPSLQLPSSRLRASEHDPDRGRRSSPPSTQLLWNTRIAFSSTTQEADRQKNSQLRLWGTIRPPAFARLTQFVRDELQTGEQRQAGNPEFPRQDPVRHLADGQVDADGWVIDSAAPGVCCRRGESLR
jgi:hypothetical protein